MQDQLFSRKIPLFIQLDIKLKILQEEFYLMIIYFLSLKMTQTVLTLFATLKILTFQVTLEV
ncbi:hypothetical protein ES703_96925 [subsurface metagenome]